MSRLTLIVAAMLTGVVTLAPAAAQERETRKSVAPYIEVGQVLLADLQRDEVTTYTTLAAGVDAAYATRRVQGQVSYRYEHRIGYDDDLADGSIHSGLARVGIQATPGVSFEAGALAARARNDIRGVSLPNGAAGDVANVNQLFSVFAGPTLSTQAGDATIAAAYRFGYNKVESSDRLSGVPANQQPLDLFDDSITHLATVSVGTRPDQLLPVGLTANATWVREDAGQLDQRFDDKFVRLDATLPVSRDLAVVGGIGYEKLEISQRDPLVDATGATVVDGDGRFVTAEGSPRRLAYQTDGIFWDAGVLWRPSARTSLEARAGRRYDSTIYTGAFSYQMSRQSAMAISVYNAVQSFGRGLNDALALLPTAFATQPDPFGNQFGGCVFGTGGQAGGCFNPVLNAITTANFRARGVDAIISTRVSAWQFGVGGGYANRRYLVPPANVPAGATLFGVVDELYYVQGFLGRDLGARSAVALNLFGNLTDSGIAGAPDVWGSGANGSWSYNWGRFGAIASAGLFTSDIEGPGGEDVAAQAALGMRYSF
jgi:hypothetical protein